MAEEQQKLIEQVAKVSANNAIQGAIPHPSNVESNE